MYKWSNKNRLKTLAVSGQDSVLTFATAGEKAQVYLKGGDINKVIFTGPSGKAITLRSKDAKRVVVGKGNACRDVYHWLKPGGVAPTMRLGLTRHRGEGTWSSLPHHFELNVERGFEEAFFHILKPATGAAIQVGRGMWPNGAKADEVWPIKDHQFSTVPMGYHPVVGEPGVEVAYVWVYLAKHQRWEKIK